MALSTENINDIGVFAQLLSAISIIIKTEEDVPTADRLLAVNTLASLNLTMKDTSDTIDAIVLASQAAT